MTKAEDKLNELIEWAKNGGALPQEDVRTLEKILETVTVSRDRSGKRHKNARFAVTLFDKADMKTWDLHPFGLQNINGPFQSIVRDYTDRHTLKASSAGFQLASEATFRDKLVADLFVGVMVKMLTSPFVCYDDPGQSGVRQIKPTADMSEAPRIVIDAVDDLIEAMDKKAEAKGIESIAGELMESLDEDDVLALELRRANMDDKPDPLKWAGDILSCHKIEVTRFSDPARPDDDNSGKNVILVTFSMEHDDVQKGAQVLIDDVWGDKRVEVIARIREAPVFHRAISRGQRNRTPDKWKVKFVESVDELSVIVVVGDQNMEFKPKAIQEFDPA